MYMVNEWCLFDGFWMISKEKLSDRTPPEFCMNIMGLFWNDDQMMIIT